MEEQGKVYISRQYQKKDFNGIRLRVESNEEDWEKAIEIFQDRIKGRYLDVINELIGSNSSDDCVMKSKKNISRDGFVIMAIDCLLLETLMQFRNGWKDTPQYNCDRYSSFLCEYFRQDFPKMEIANKFYRDIRCGILHSAQTKNGSRLSFDCKKTVNLFNGDRNIEVDVVKMTKQIEKYYNTYIEELNNESEEQLRKNFIKKMNFICKEIC